MTNMIKIYVNVTNNINIILSYIGLAGLLPRPPALISSLESSSDVLHFSDCFIPFHADLKSPKTTFTKVKSPALILT